MLMRLAAAFMTSSIRHPLVAALVVIGYSMPHHAAPAHGHPSVALDVVLSEAEYQPDARVSGEVHVRASVPLVGLVRMIVVNETTGLPIHRRLFPVLLLRAGTKRIPFSIVPTPPPDSYRVVATVLTSGFPNHPAPLARATADFRVDAMAPSAALLPFWLSYCADPTCGGLPPLIVRVCPSENASCSPSRETTVVPRLDGRQIDQILLTVQPPVGGPDLALTLVSGAGSMIGSAAFVSFSSPVILRSDADVTLSHYDVIPVWGGTTNLDLVSASTTSPELVTTVYRHPTFLGDDEVAQLHQRGRDIVAVEKQISGIDPGQLHAIFLPTELATLGEGNFSDGNLGIVLNYGNPDFIAFVGSVYDVVMPRFAHEYVHELFSEVAQSHPGNNSCLNEGLADAFAYAAGLLPERDFGPVGLRGADFGQGCAEIVQDFEMHDAGNCPFWQVRRLGLLSPAFVAAVLRPHHAIEFDSCDLTAARTGNALVVLFSEAAGVDMTASIEMAEIPNAGSLEAARRALGL
jgi:hypothetical protein